MTAVSPGAGEIPSALLGAGAVGGRALSEVDRVAASLMLPRLAAFGPAVHLRTWQAQQVAVEAPRWGWSQVMAMAATTVLGLSALLVPTSVLVYAVGEMSAARAPITGQQVPSSATPVVEPDVLTPALAQP